MTPRTSTQWTQEMDERIRQQRAAGVSFSVLQVNLNYEFQLEKSRNAVIGRARRLGIGVTRVPKPARCPPSPRTLRHPNSPAPMPVASQSDLHRSLLLLADNACKWPMGDSYCGSPALRRKSYCEFHAEESRRKT